MLEKVILFVNIFAILYKYLIKKWKIKFILHKIIIGRPCSKSDLIYRTNFKHWIFRIWIFRMLYFLLCFDLLGYLSYSCCYCLDFLLEIDIYPNSPFSTWPFYDPPFSSGSTLSYIPLTNSLLCCLKLRLNFY